LDDDVVLEGGRADVNNALFFTLRPLVHQNLVGLLQSSDYIHFYPFVHDRFKDRQKRVSSWRSTDEVGQELYLLPDLVDL
jgi:hypothetical protein